ncbi:MAG: iron-sulfur cluster-binding protein [Phycisphaerae bacterium]|nr:iron-sulfur cluster-binding protein [Phycisphaerae bacterium]
MPHAPAHPVPGPLTPTLPYDLGPRAAAATRDVRLQQFVNAATLSKDRARRAAFDASFGVRADDLRDLAARIKQHTLDHLDHYLERFDAAARARGTVVHYAADAAEANRIVVDLARARGCRRCVKSKSMLTEETGLVPALEAAGVRAVETDLGEFILQIDGDAPSHIVTPMIHKDRAAVGRAFQRALGVPYTDEPAALAAIARRHLRDAFRRADLGVSGGNFLIAETGELVLCTNEGNGRLSTSCPPIHVALVGIEKLIPRRADLAVMLKLLARSATAQPLTCYTSIIGGPRAPSEPDGPREVHVVLVDNGRVALLADETRELLRCIRCGACLNACPVYRKIGGHAYGSVYSGPIGAVLTPPLKGLANYPDLPHASSLCGACVEACPVKIDIPRQLIRLRTEMVRRRIAPAGGRFLMRAWAWVLRSPRRYRAALALQRALLRALADDLPPHASPYASRGWIAHALGPLAGWTSQRDLPTPTPLAFRDWWRRRETP